MNFNRHSEISEGEHALFGASKFSWINKSMEDITTAYYNSYATEIGTALHDIAKRHIENLIKIDKSKKSEILFELVSYYGIPRHVIDIDAYYENLMHYINDAIGFRLQPEVILKYSDLFFGTADAIEFKKNKLRIHDLKTGTTKTHMEQLLIYAALFCLEYDVKPGEIEMELRIYQSGSVVTITPDATDIVPIMDKIVTMDKHINSLREES